MMKLPTQLITLFCLAAFVAFTSSCLRNPSGQGISVTFEMTSASLSPDVNVYITGGTEELGGWNPRAVQMEYKGEHQWIKEITFKTPLTIEYKYTLGTWEREGAFADGSSLPNFSITPGTDTVIRDRIESWTAGDPQPTPATTVTGETRIHRGIQSEGLPPRDIIVWLPEGYEKEPDRRYPVIYMHDGQNVFDASTSAFGTEWQVDECLDSLIRQKVIPPVIAVGIYNTRWRTAEYTPGDTGTIYMDFVANTLKPFIDSAYRTRPEPEHTITGGASAGGLIAFMLAWEHPEAFSKAICMSSAFKIKAIDYVKTVSESGTVNRNLYFYIYIGGVDLESRLRPGNDEMIEAIENKGLKNKLNYTYVVDDKGRHSEATWAMQFPNAMLHCLTFADE